jgi:hypothetical protein
LRKQELCEIPGASETGKKSVGEERWWIESSYLWYSALQKDKQSGVSVVMKQLPNGGGVDFKLSGECHSKEPPVFISTR